MAEEHFEPWFIYFGLILAGWIIGHGSVLFYQLYLDVYESTTFTVSLMLGGFLGSLLPLLAPARLVYHKWIWYGHLINFLGWFTMFLVSCCDKTSYGFYFWFIIGRVSTGVFAGLILALSPVYFDHMTGGQQKILAANLPHLSIVMGSSVAHLLNHMFEWKHMLLMGLSWSIVGFMWAGFTIEVHDFDRSISSETVCKTSTTQSEYSMNHFGYIVNGQAVRRIFIICLLTCFHYVLGPFILLTYDYQLCMAMSNDTQRCSIWLTVALAIFSSLALYGLRSTPKPWILCSVALFMGFVYWAISLCRFNEEKSCSICSPALVSLLWTLLCFGCSYSWPQIPNLMILTTLKPRLYQTAFCLSQSMWWFVALIVSSIFEFLPQLWPYSIVWSVMSLLCFIATMITLLSDWNMIKNDSSDCHLESETSTLLESGLS